MEVVIMIIVIAVAVVGMIISPILAVRIVREKGHDTSLWGLFGFFGGALAVIAAACMKDKNAPRETFLDFGVPSPNRSAQEFGNVDTEQKIVCPVCGKDFMVDRFVEETVCPYCGKKLKRKKKTTI